MRPDRFLSKTEPVATTGRGFAALGTALRRCTDLQVTPGQLIQRPLESPLVRRPRVRAPSGLDPDRLHRARIG